MTYDKQIQRILAEVGMRGISVQSLAKHVYNQNNTLFSSSNWEEVYSYVRQYLLRNSKSPYSLIERTERRGYYRLNTKGSDDARQLVLNFRDEQTEQEEPHEELPQKDCSLDLFGDF